MLWWWLKSAKISWRTSWLFSSHQNDSLPIDPHLLLTSHTQHKTSIWLTLSTYLIFYSIQSHTASGREMHWIINSHVEASKIGRKIANQVIDYHRRFDNSSSGNFPYRKMSFDQKLNFLSFDLTIKKTVRCHLTNHNRALAPTYYHHAKTVVPVTKYLAQTMHQRPISNGLMEPYRVITICERLW